MTFTQPIFFIFIVAFLLGWRTIGQRSSFRLTYLVMVSLVFYSFADWRQVLVLLAAGLVSFAVGIGIEDRPRCRGVMLAAGITFCAGLLFIFKYSAFFMTNLAIGLALLGVQFDPQPFIPGISRIPTLGLSFYTLQAAGYLLDVYHGRIKASRSLQAYLAFLALFPRLLAGPIEKGKDLLPQLEADHTSPTESQRWEGTRLIVYGYFVKVVIADNLAPFVDSAFNALFVKPNTFFWWVVITAFAFQLYCDFSGYSAIAVGLGKWMGYDLTVNFKHPYLSTSLSEFWTRWHISLSTWLRDTIFFPLSRSGWGRNHPYINLWITMLFSGLWHGAAWQFILWGAIHALFNSLERLTQWPNRLKRLRWGPWAARILVLLQIWTAWVFFRATSVTQGWQIIQVMFGFKGGLEFPMDRVVILALALGILREACALLNLNRKPFMPGPLRNRLEVAGIVLLILAAIFLRGPGSQFIYFQF